MANTKVDIFTTAMRTEFLTAWEATAEPAPYEQFTTIVPSTARIENYAWMSPVPAVSQYQGYRRLGKIAEVKYTVPNVEYDNAFEVLLRDVQDDQVGGYKLKPQELAEKAKLWPSRLILQTLATGPSSLCFDGSYYFATTHKLGGVSTLSLPSGFGGSGNALTFTAASADGKTHNMIFMITNQKLKPMLYQRRKDPDFQTDAGSPESFKRKIITYWIDFEAAAAFGYWWNALWIQITNTPTITEMQQILGVAEAAFKSFKLPSGLAGDLPEYIHEQIVHKESNTVVAANASLANLLRQVLSMPVIVQSGAAVSNIYHQWASWTVSNFLNTVA